jgi:hypothetical protein
MSSIVAPDRIGVPRAISPRVFFPALSILLFIPILQTNYWPVGNGVDVVGYPIGRDFINVWVGPRLAFGDHVWKLFNLQAYHAAIGTEFGQPLPWHNWGYPLFVLLAFWPLAQLPYFAALVLWTFGLFAIFAGVTLSQVERSMRPLALMLLLLAPATLINAVGGQNGFATAALLLGGILMLDRRPVLAGILFGLLTSKPHLGLVLPFALIALGAWRAIAAASVTAAVLIAISLAVFGLDAWRAYLEFAGQFQLGQLERFRGFSMLMMVSVLNGARTFGLSHSAAIAIQVMVAIPVLAVATWAVRRTADPARRAFVLVSATTLVTPYAFNYDLPALTAVILWQLCARQNRRLARTCILLLAWLAPLGAMYLNAWGLGLAPLALMAVFALAVREAAAGRHGQPSIAPATAPMLSSAAS